MTYEEALELAEYNLMLSAREYKRMESYYQSEALECGFVKPDPCKHIFMNVSFYGAAKEALEKQIAEKPIRNVNRKTNPLYSEDACFCPNCSSYVKTSFCPQCGQKIDQSGFTIQKSEAEIKYEEEKSKLREQMRTEYENGKRWCYDCVNYRESTLCGYTSPDCKKYGSLDVDQRERHPDSTADTCKDYVQKEGPLWFEEKQNRKRR